MKRFITCCALLGLVVLTACSGDSPSPRPLPTPAPDTWAITSVTVDNADPYVNVGVYITATVTKNGSPAPDGTAVEFIATGGSVANETGFFVAFNSPQAIIATEGGQATILFVASTPGPVAFRVRVVDAVRTDLTVTYREPSAPEVLQITSIQPGVGSRLGGEQVVITGTAIVPPIEVAFIVAGETYQADILEWQASNPLSDPGTITVRTPRIEGIMDDPCTEYWADVSVRVGIGTGNAQSTVVIGGFLFLVEDALCNPPPEAECPPAPEIYQVMPDHGSSAGGEQITILGRNFGMYWDSVAQEFRYQAVGSVQVDFITPTRTLRGIDPVVSPDGHQISVTTPRYGAVPLDEDVIVSVKVTSLVDRADVCGTDELSDTRTEAFVYNADVPTPEILAVAPTAGPLDGGTVVTIFGHGFQFPVQVMFAPPSVPPREATVIEVNDDTSPADNDTIIVQTPTFADSGLVPPVAVDVKVTNVSSGLNDTLEGAFTYGANLFISGNTPTRGGRGTVVTIYGNGFEDPLHVDFGNIRLDIVAVSGTEVIVRFPDDETPECQDITGAFTVTLLDSNETVTGGSFTYLGLNPVVISVDPPIVQETLGGAGVTPMDVDIYGQRFTDEALVEISSNGTTSGYTIPSQYVDVVSDTLIEISQLPSPNDFGLEWETSPCVTPQGQNGNRRVATPVDVTVTNIPGECSDTLTGGLVYEPEDSDCVVAGYLSATQLTFPETASPAPGVSVNCSPPQTLNLSSINNPNLTPPVAGDIDIQTLNLIGRFFFDEGYVQELPGFTIPAYGFNTSVQVYFCPDVDNNLLYSGQLVIRSDASNDPYIMNLTGQEGRPNIQTTPANGGTLDFPSGTTTGVIVIENNGLDELNWSANRMGTNVGEFTITSAASGSLNPGGTFDLTISYAANVAVTTAAQIEITHDDPLPPPPGAVVINLTGTP